jgi:hypothetical protein
MAKITEVRLDRTFNLGNYESLKIGLTADVDQEDDVQEVLNELKQEAKSFYRQAKI